MEPSKPRKKSAIVRDLTIRAKVKRGVLELLEKLDLPEGMEITVKISKEVIGKNRALFDGAAGSWKGTVDADALIHTIYTNRLFSTRPEPQL